jgi:hypothetical protein
MTKVRPTVPDPKGEQPIATVVVLTPVFKVVFISIFSLTIISLAVSLLLVVFGKENKVTEQLIETCSTTWKLGFGAIIGLIGGKAL